MSFFKLISNLLGISKKKEVSNPHVKPPLPTKSTVSNIQSKSRSLRPSNKQQINYYDANNDFGYAPQINDIHINTVESKDFNLEDDSYKRSSLSYSSPSSYHSSNSSSSSSSDSSSSSCDSSSSSSSSCD